MQYARFLVFLLSGLVIVGCGGGMNDDEVVEKSAFKMPTKENTWVRKETVSKSKEEFFANAGKKSTEVSIDPALKSKLKKPAELFIKIKEECLARADALDQKRTEVQKRGGIWHAYEKVVQAKPYSNYGMQLDSQINRLVFSLQHICKNAEEIHLSGWGAETVRQFESMGKEGFTNHFLTLGAVSGDIDRWVRFAEFAIQSRERKVPYSEIGESLAQAQPLVDLYDDLSQRKISDDASLQTFLTEGATLLNVINESFTTDPRIVLALQYEEVFPFEDLKGHM
jgi:hypothetical protein